MDENTIFQNPSDFGVQKERGQQEALSRNPIVPPPPEELPSSPPPSTFFKVLKIILGIVIVAIVIFAVFNFVLPKLFPGNKINQVKLTYWGLWEDLAQVQPIISEFEKANPNIKIEYSKQDINQYRERLVVRSNNGNGPDIFRFHNSWVPMLSTLLLPLPSNVISKEDFMRSYYPVAASDLIRNGAIYGIPLHMDTLSLFINRDLFQAAGLNPPTTWIEFGNYSRQLTVKDENGNIKTAGSAMGTYSNITHAPDIISMLFAQDGVDLKDISSNSQAAIDALTFYTSFASPLSNVWDNTLDQSIKMFASGSLAMYFGYSWDFFTIKSMNPSLSFDVYTVPNLPGQNATIASYWPIGASSKSSYQKEALLFLKHLSFKETQEKLFKEESKVRNFGELYSRVDLADSLKNSVAYPFISGAQSAVSSFFVDSTYDDSGINSKMSKLMNNSVDSILKGESVQSAVETLSKETSQLLQQYGQ